MWLTSFKWQSECTEQSFVLVILSYLRVLLWPLSLFEDLNVCPTNALQLQHHTQRLEDNYFNIWDGNAQRIFHLTFLQG